MRENDLSSLRILNSEDLSSNNRQVSGADGLKLRNQLTDSIFRRGSRWLRHTVIGPETYPAR